MQTQLNPFFPATCIRYLIHIQNIRFFFTSLVTNYHKRQHQSLSPKTHKLEREGMEWYLHSILFIEWTIAHKHRKKNT